MLLCGVTLIQATPEPPGERAWIIADKVYALTQIIESKLELLLMVSGQTECASTFTMLSALESTINTALLSAEEINSFLDFMHNNIPELVSQVSEIIKEISIVDQQMYGIHASDFSGTWTALEALEYSLGTSIESTVDYITILESKANQLIIDNTSFADMTLASLREVSLDAFNTFTMMQSLSDTITLFLVDMPSIIDVAEESLFVLESNVATLQQDAQNCFISTLTTLNSSILMLQTINERSSSIESIVENVHFVFSFTTLQGELLSIDSVADAIIDELNLATITFNNLLQ